MDDTFQLGPAAPLVVALKRPADFERVGPISRQIAAAFDAPVELVTILSPDDDLAEETRLFAGVVAAIDVGAPACCRLVVSDRAADAFLDRCTDRVVCMATAASPFKEGHYVGSFAAALLARSASPVFLVGPEVGPMLGPIDEVVAAVSDDSASLAVLPYARQLAAAFDLPVSTVHVDKGTGNVYTNEYGEPQMWFPDSVHASLGVEALDGDGVASTLVHRSVGAMVAVATSARQGLAWIAEGSVAFDVISSASAPVLAVGPNIGKLGRVADDLDGRVMWLSGQSPDDAAAEIRTAAETPGNHIAEVIYSPADTDVFDR